MWCRRRYLQSGLRIDAANRRKNVLFYLSETAAAFITEMISVIKAFLIAAFPKCRSEKIRTVPSKGLFVLKGYRQAVPAPD